MPSFLISTDAIFSPTRNSVLRLQSDLARAQKEVSTGTHADIGLTLGGGTTGLTQMLQSQAWREAISGSNALSATRLDMSQTALTSAVGTAQNFLDQLLAAKGSITTATAITTTAMTAVASFAGQLNTEIAGVHVFGGENSGSVPVANYAQSGSAPSTAIANAFSTAFGMSQSSASVSTITPAQMQTFLDGAFAAEFSAANWSANWSQASSNTMQMQISDYESVEVGASANEKPFRDLAQAYVMIADLGGDKLDPNTFQVVVDKANLLVSSAITAMAGVQSRLGSSQARIRSADESLSAQGAIITNQIAKVRQVDPYVASTTVNTLVTQLQASYAVTARLQQMSLTNYL